jgi:hypothetical protein
MGNGSGGESDMDFVQFFTQFEDYLAPRLDTYEQAIYLYIFRQSRFIGNDVTVIGFKSARRKMALGVGKKDTSMSERIVYEKLRSLSQKGCIELLGSERTGTRIRLKLPDEIPGIIPAHEEPGSVALEDMDFFNVPENRSAILRREKHLCFYCLRKLDQENHVIEHVFRPQGDNSYRNVAAACRACNNKKGNMEVSAFLRQLYRDGYLDEGELEKRFESLSLLQSGELKPDFSK